MSGGDDAIQREVLACIEEEIERTDSARNAFKAKVAKIKETQNER